MFYWLILELGCRLPKKRSLAVSLFNLKGFWLSTQLYGIKPTTQIQAYFRSVLKYLQPNPKTFFLKLQTGNIMFEICIASLKGVIKCV